MSFASLARAALTGAALLLAAALPAHAETPAQKGDQVGGWHRFKLGGFEVTALYDGYIDLPQKVMLNISAKTTEELLRRMFVDYGKGIQTAVNAYLVHTGTRLVLVDAGTAKAFGPTLGFIPDNIRAAGYDPAQVDAVLLTHLHPDHAAGLLGADGKPAFPNAEIWVAKAEADFWLDEAVAAKMPEANRVFFKMARDAVAPYKAAGKLHAISGQVGLPAGIAAVDTNGHTPGHTSYLLTSQGQSLLVLGDLVHNHAVQFAHPEVAFEYDSDRVQAVKTRKKVFADAAKQRLWVAGAHLPFPGIGHVRAEGKAFAWVPLEYSPLRKDR
ncbi:putative Metallo-beta-lactamase superfamily protein, zn-dependent hydrolase protein [Magnetospirillum sp. XM-1]|uniref:MBL fold metallo-hydrolase n=1 Tax=Magnetospirillum sp. XM-1 TaxID=1663591 RepID=UPI00073DFA17|nr:MBL fold metallo-hydrolase [Magnetospirillum sp. XM-1]CUW37338.1 putative Metallo-beta-lactamase superfamily protein, zn-dependent hydrolase protein [Magnetospirillum sp. XM-1]